MGSRFERDVGSARAVVDGEWVLVSGAAGFGHAAMIISPDVAEQAGRVLAGITSALA